MVSARIRFSGPVIAAVLAFSVPAKAVELWNGQGYVDNGVVVGGQYGVERYGGARPRYIAPGYTGSGLRPYLQRYHDRYEDTPAVALTRPDVPVMRGVQPRPRFRAYDGSPALSGTPTGWCKQTYRSFRASDNSYQPYSGPRRQCSSP